MHWKNTIVLVCVLPALTMVAQEPSKEAPRTQDEYQVYAVAVDLFHHSKNASHLLIADHTSSFACDPGGNGMHMGGCDGLRTSDETEKDRLGIVRRDLPQVISAVLDDFEQKNQQRSEIQATIPAKTKYFLWSQNKPPDLPGQWWDDVSYLFLSRPGFDPGGTQALLYVGFISGTNAKDSAGEYFLFIKKSGAWVPAGSSPVWKLR